MNDPVEVLPTSTEGPAPEVQSTEETPSSRNEVAHEVLAGLWGRGNKRTEKLTAEGYDPVKIQEEVDKILKGK